jgi:hypothetical protein
MNHEKLIEEILGNPMSANANEEFTEACYTLYGELKCTNCDIIELAEIATQLGVSETDRKRIENQVVNDIANSVMNEVSEKGFTTKSEKQLVQDFIKCTGLDVDVDEDIHDQFITSYMNFVDYCGLINESEIESLTRVTLMSNARNPSVLDSGALIVTNNAVIFAGKRKTLNIKKSVIRNMQTNEDEILIMKKTSSNHIRLIKD